MQKICVRASLMKLIRFTRKTLCFSFDVIFIIMQGIFQLIVLFYVALPISKGKDPNILAVSSSVIGLISLLIGELGCLHNSSSSFYFFLEVLHPLTLIHCLLFKAEGGAEEVSWNFTWPCQPSQYFYLYHVLPVAVQH